MSETTPINSNNKQNTKPRLGRGLGSLLGGVNTQETTGRPATGFEKADTEFSPNTTGETTPVTTSNLQGISSTNQVFKTASSTPLDPAVSPPITAAPAIPETARIWNVAIEKIVANTQQPRQVFEDAALKELAASIKEKGILQPITARRRSETEFEIIAGERRWRAAQLAGLKEVPVILKTVTEQDSLEFAILENIQRADLNPVEEAEAYDHLMKAYGLTQVQVADRLGKERPTIANALRLLVLPPEVKLMIGGGELSSGHAKVLLGLESMADQIDLAKEVIREKLSVRALERKVAEIKSKTTGSSVKAATPMGLDVSSKLVEALAGELQKLIGTRVVIDYADKRGKLSVYFHSDEQLTEIVERMRKGWAKQNAAPNVSSRN
jgi:ParB family chromosome partitioning protein